MPREVLRRDGAEPARRTIVAMWLRRAYYGWLIPAAFLLPLWLLVGWGVFDAGGWAFLWVMFIAIPAVLLGQLGLTLLVRARTTTRGRRAVSWWDVAGFTLWHALIVALGFFVESWWAPVFVLSVCVGLALFWLEIWQLWRQATTSRMLLSAVTGVESIAPRGQRSAAVDDVFVITERTTTRR